MSKEKLYVKYRSISYIRLDLPPLLNFWEFFPLYIKGPVDILQQAMNWELQIKL